MNSFGLGVVLKFTDNFSLGVGTATTAFNGLSQVIDSQSAGITNTLMSLCNTASSIGTQLTTAITTPVTAIAGTFLQYGVARASFVENATLAFSTLMGDTKKASAYLQELMDFAKTTPFTYETIASVAQQFLAYGTDMDSVLKSLSEDGTQFSGILQALGDAAGGLGKGESFIAEVSESLVRMKTDIESGTSTTVRLQQLESRGLQVSRILGNMWGVQGASASVISEYMKDNNITYSKFLDSLTEGIEKGTDGINGTTAAMAGLMANIKNTWTGALDTWKSSLKTAGKELMDYDEDTGTYGFLTDMTKALNRCSAAVKVFAPLLQPLVSDIRSAMSSGSAYLEEITNKWSKVSDETKDKVGRFIEVLVLLGPALLVVGKAGGAVTSIFSSFGGSAVKSIKFLFSPIGVLTGLVVGLVASFIYLWNTSDKFRESIKTSFAGLSSAWSKFADPIKESLGKVGEAFLNLFENVAVLLTPAFTGFFDSLGDFGSSSAPNIVNVLNGLASVIQFIADKVELLNQKWESLPESTQDKISGIIGNVLLLALGLMTLFKVFKSISGASSIIDNLPFIGGKSKKNSSGGSSSGGFLTNPKNVAKSMASVAIIFGGVAILVTALGALMSIPYFSQFLVTGTETVSKLFSVIIPLTVTIGALATLVAVIEKFKINPKNASKGFADIAILLGGLTILITAIGALESIPYFSDFLSTGVDTMNKLYSVILPVTVMVGALSLLVLAFDLLEVSPKDAAIGFANIAIILGGFTVLVTAVGALASIPYFSDFISTGVDTLTSLFTTMKVFTTGEFWLMLVAIVALGLFSPALVASGLAGLAIAIGGMTLIITAFGALSMIDGFNDFLKSGGETLSILFQQVGKAVGSLIGGLGEGITQSLPNIGTNLSDFAKNIKPFFEVMSNAPTEEIGGFMVAFGEFMLMMTASEILSFLTGELDLAGLGTQLNSFGTNAQSFFTTVAEYPEEGLTKAKLVFEALAGMGNYDFKTGGLFQLFTGTTDMEEMGRQLALFAPDAKEFFNSVKDYSKAGLEKAPDVFEALKGMGNYDFKTWGLAQLFTGTTALDEMGRQLSEFAPKAKTFFNTVKDYEDSGLEKAPKVFESLNGMGDYDFKTWGLAQLFTGTTDLATMGEQLSAFAPKAKEFYNTVKDYPETGIEKSQKVLQAIANIGTLNFKSGGVVEWFTGSNGIDALGTKLADFGTNSEPFFTQMENTTIKSINRAESVLGLLDIVGGVSNRSGGLLQTFIGEVDVAKLGEQLSSFGKNIKTFLTYASETSEKGMEKAPKVFESAEGAKALIDIASADDSTKLSSLGLGLSLFIINSDDFFNRAVNFTNTKSIVTLADHLEDFLTVIKNFDNTKLTTTVTNIGSLSTATKNFSTDLSNVTTGIQNNSGKIKNAVTTSVNSCITVLNTFAGSGSIIGNNLMVSIANGIYSNAWQIQQAVQSAVNSIQVSMPTISNKAASSATRNMPHLASGGVTTSPTVALIGEGKDNEAVLPLNDETFANIAKGIVAQSITNNSVNSGDKVTNDYSVTFSAGSIQINLTGTSDEEIEQVAEKLENIIMRRQEIRKMANR